MNNTLIKFWGKVITAIIYRQKRIEILNLKLLPNIFIHGSFYVGAGTYFVTEKGIKELRIGENVVVRKCCNFVLHPDASLIINDGVFLNNYCSISCLGRIEIGTNTMFGEGVKIYDHNHSYSYDDTGVLNIERDHFTIGNIKIGSNCWIGSNVTILNDVEIGDNVIIGANSLIYKSVKSNSIVKSSNTMSVVESNVNAK
jgi:acetyltransferase-like isoleucine patch superfamily enzyme